MENPYLDHNFKNIKEDVELTQEYVYQNITDDPRYYAQVLTDLYFKWKHGIFDTPTIARFHEQIEAKNAPGKRAKLREGEHLYIPGYGEVRPGQLFYYRYDENDHFYLIIEGKEYPETSTAFDFI